MDVIELYVDDNEKTRLDIYLANKLEKISRNKIQGLINKGLVLVNGKKEKSKYIVKKDDFLQISIPKVKPIEILPENIDLNIIYQDKDIVIINKKQEMVVHPALGHYTGTLVNGLLFHINSLSDIGGAMRPGIVHRLDKDTSGLLIIAKNNYAHEFLVNQFKKRTVKRKYMALVHGGIKDNKGIIEKPIGRDPRDRKKMSVNYANGKKAITKYKVVKRFGDFTLLEVELKTGRTHQIRVHLSHINHPIVGDTVYSKRKNRFKLDKQLLHAIEIGFIHPSSKTYVDFRSDIPEKFNEILNKLK